MSPLGVHCTNEGLYTRGQSSESTVDKVLCFYKNFIKGIHKTQQQKEVTLTYCLLVERSSFLPDRLLSLSPLFPRISSLLVFGLGKRRAILFL